MTSRLRTWFRRLRSLLWTAVALLILMAAILVGVGKLLLPYSVRYQPQLETLLSEQFNQPVRVDAFTGEWKAFGPRISLEGVNLLGAAGDGEAMVIRRAALDIKPLNALISGRPLYSFRIIGADLALVRLADGRYELSGLGVSRRDPAENERPRPGTGLNSLARVGEVRLENSSFSFDDDVRGIHVQLIEVNGRLQMNDDELALEVQASVSDSTRSRVLGDLSATVLASISPDQRLQALEWYIETGELMLSPISDRLPQHDLTPTNGWLNAQLWGSWAPEEAQRMSGVVNLRDATLEADGQVMNVDRLGARGHWVWHDRTRWRLDLADVRVQENGRDWTSPRLALERHLAGGLGIWVGADYLEAEFPLQVTQVFMKQFNARWPRIAPTAGRGVIRDFDIVISDEKLLTLTRGQFDDLKILEWGDYPQVAGLSGRIDLAYGEGSLFVRGEDAIFEWPRNFRAPLQVELPECEIEILWGERWQVDVLGCRLSHPAIELVARTRFAQSEGKPVADINAYARRLDLAALSDYWPQSIMSPKVTEWLRGAVRAGEARDTRFILTGDLDNFPFRDGDGTMLAEATLAGATLDYYPGWPRAENVNARVRFDGPGLSLDGRIGGLSQVEVQEVSARIDDLKQPVLTLDYNTDTSLPGLVNFLDASPLLEQSELDLEAFEFAGPVTVSGRLMIPFGRQVADQEKVQVNGVLELKSNQFLERRSGLRLENITGAANYDSNGFSAGSLATTLDGWPAGLQLRSEWDAKEVFNATLDGRFPASLVVGQSPLSDDPLLARLEGESDWRAELSVTRADEAQPNEIWLNLTSPLEGVAVDLPVPLKKPPETRRSLALRTPIQSSTPLMTVVLDDLAILQMEIDEGEFGVRRGALQFGTGMPALPATGNFTVAGSVDEFDLDNWLDIITDYFEANRYPGNLEFERADLQAGALIMVNRSFKDVTLSAGYDDDVLATRFDSADLAGEVRYSRNPDGTHSLNAQMERLLMPDALDAGMTMESNPANLPELHFYVEQFRYAGLDMGETRIEAFPVANGLRFESIEAVSPNLTFQARGDWISTEAGSRSDFDMVLTSESLGSLVSALDLSSVLEGGQTMIRYDAWWPGPPAAFELARLNGEMTFSVIDGRILNANPGAGRVLGLMSITALPRRLALDFRDVFESGFGFDQASGTVQLEGGSAQTTDFLLESTAARLSITGSSNLVDQTFDHQMTVRPGVSQALPVIGAIAGGPVGAAAGLALQGLLQESLGDATEARYQITGPWADPEVTRLEVLATTPEPATQTPAEAGLTEEKNE